MTKPNQGDIQTLDDLLAVLKSAPNRQAMKSEPVRLYSKLVPHKRKASGQSTIKSVAFEDNTERQLAHLLTTLYPAVKMPAAAALAGQPQNAETTLLACQINTANTDQPYNLTEVKLVKKNPKYSGKSTYSVYCDTRKQWSNATQAGVLRHIQAPNFEFDSVSHWAARVHVESFGGTVAFTGDCRGPNEYADYTCGHGAVQTVEVGGLAKGSRPTTNCHICADIVNSQQTGPINHSTNITESSASDGIETGTLYVVQAIHRSTQTPIVKLGYTARSFADRYTTKELSAFEDLKVIEGQYANICARHIEAIIHTVMSDHRISIDADDVPAGFRSETYSPDCLPLLKQGLDALADLPLPDLITHPVVLDNANLNADRKKTIRSFSDNRNQRN